MKSEYLGHDGLPALALQDSPTLEEEAMPRGYPCLDCGHTYPGPDHACPQEGTRR